MFSSIDSTATNLSLNFKEHKKHTTDELTHLHASDTSTPLSVASHISKINSKLEVLNTHISEKEGKELVELVKMHKSVTALAQQLSVILFQHKEQIVFEYSMVETAITSSKSSLETIRSKLKSLAATTAQLSSYHHSMESDISSAKCLDTDEGVYTAPPKPAEQPLTPAGDHSTIRGFPASAHLWRDRRMETCCLLGHV